MLHHPSRKRPYYKQAVMADAGTVVELEWESGATAVLLWNRPQQIDVMTQEGEKPSKWYLTCGAIHTCETSLLIPPMSYR